MSRFRWPRGRDEGFVLIESIVTISLITIIMTALASFFLNAIASTNQQRARQSATQLATSAVEAIRGLHSSDLVTGRDAGSVTSQFAAATEKVRPWLASMTQAVDDDAAAGSGATAAVPTATIAQTRNAITYQVTDYLGWCGMPVGASSADCDTASLPSGIRYLRAVVAVTWPDRHCPGSTCSYVTATLLSTDDDPTFNLNRTPPATPVVENAGSQTSVVGDTVALQLTVKDGTGVPTFTWQLTGGSLPAGLALNPAGTVSGSPTTQVTNRSVTVTVTDAFLRTASATFTWTVLPALVIAPPGDQASVIGSGIAPLTLTASGGSGTPYTWSDPGGTLPPGLIVSTVSNQGRVTGTPTTPGVYPVQLTVKDSTGTRSSTIGFSWTISYPPLAATTPLPQKSTVGTAISPLQLAATGGSGSYTWTGGGSLPAGLTMTSAGRITGTPTTLGGVAVSLMVTDAGTGAVRTVGFVWTVIARPTIASPGNQTTTVGATVSLALTSSCPNSPCAYTVDNGPATLTVSGTGVVTGTITSAAQTFAAVTVRLTDAAGATATTTAFTWRINPAPAITGPGDQLVRTATADSLDLAALVTGGTAPYTYSASGLPTWLALDPSTGLISGTAPATRSVTSGVTVRVTDSRGVAVTSAAFRWIVTDLVLSITDRTTYRQATVSLDLDTLVSGGQTPYTYTAAGLPSWLSLNGSTGVLSGKAPTGLGATTGITITVTDGAGAVITSAPFTWHVTSLTWSTIPGQISLRGVADVFDTATYDSGGTAPLGYTATGLPPGLTINAGTGRISGIPTTSSTYSVKVTVTDATGASVTSAAFSWWVL